MVATRREAVILATAFGLCVLGGTLQVDGTLAPPAAVAYAMALASCAVLPVRHRRPLFALVATTVIGVLVQPLGILLSPLNMAPIAITAYAYTLTSRSEKHSVIVLLTAAAALGVSSIPWAEDLSWQDASRMGAVAAFPLVAGVFGHAVRNRRAYLAAVEERASRAEETRESEALRRVAEERVRIARELHDLVAHQITLANAQATVAAHLFDSRPEQTRKSLNELVETTSNALDDLRATVGLLRQSGDAAAPAEPAPGLSGLPALINSFSRAGLKVSLQQEGKAIPLPPSVDLTAYRIVQEALTNVTKHSGADQAQVRLAWAGPDVTITVTDDAGAPARTRRPTSSSIQDRPPGFGLIGMRERATAVGGHVSAEKQRGGGFRVLAQLPTNKNGGRLAEATMNEKETGVPDGDTDPAGR